MRCIQVDQSNNIIGWMDWPESSAPAGWIGVSDSIASQIPLNFAGYQFSNGAITAPAGPTAAQQLQQAQQSQLQILQSACQGAITAGFASSALGQPYTYGSQLTDQSNLQSALYASQGQPTNWTAPLKCSDSMGNWLLRPHTAAQLQQVNLDWLKFRTAYQQQLDDLSNQAKAAKTPADAQRVAWPS